MATVYGIVRQSGGHIRVKTQLHRTAFTVTCRASKAMKSDAAIRAVAPPARADETVLVVEDEEAVQALARRGCSWPADAAC